MRHLSSNILKDLEKKFVLICGPRQTGKTTLAKSLMDSFVYLNFDVPEERLIIKDKSWDKNKKLLILDELHKFHNWKLYLKGLTDSSNHKMQTLVTGSARLDIAKKVGDSLAGRYFLYHMFPIDIKEASSYFNIEPNDAFNRILNVGGFPEPFLSNDIGEYQRWRRTHTDIILRQDLIQLESVEELVKIETLIELLKTRVGSIVAYSNLAKDLDVAPKTVKRWLTILENLFVIFSVTPYSGRVSRTLKKSPKYYFYDCASIVEDKGARFENLVALALRKEIFFRNEAFGDNLSLYFARNTEKEEIDFLILQNGKIINAIECKWSDTTPHKAFKNFGRKLGIKKAIQLVAKPDYEKSYEFGLEVKDAVKWLERVEF